VVVATPARLVDHLHNTHSVGLDSLTALVLDEADRMLEIGFMDQVTLHCTDVFVANRMIKVWHGATENGP
jgi:superfamily II DNA/RNA helicase